MPNLRPDLSSNMLDALTSLMLAQAQEAVWHKAIMEHMKSGTVARLAIKVADYYSSVLSDKSVCELLPSSWHTYIRIKAAYYTATSQYNKANECISLSRYGEEIARLRLAASFNRQALEAIESGSSFLRGSLSINATLVNKVETLEKSIHADLLRAEKDNDLVYMETVPQVSLLPPILRSDMVKPVMPSAITNPTQYIKSSAGEFNRPLFESLVPLAVHQAASVYADQKEQIMDVDIAGKYQVIQRDYESLMQSLDLPRALDIVDPNVLPTSLVLCNEEVQHGGGIRAIRDMINNVQTMSLKAADIVDEGFDAIEEENNHDEILRRQYGNLWTRPPSQLLTKALLTEGSKHHDTIQAAQKADRIVRAKLGSWSRPIEMLSRPVEEMKDSLPSIVSDESHYTQLQNLIDRLRKLIQESEDAAKFRQHLVEDARKLAAEDDISEALLAKASELTGGIPTVKIEPEQFKGVFTQELKKYGKFQLDMNTSVDAQVDRLETMQQVYEEFAMIVRSSDGAAKRQKAIQNLEMGFDKFKEIRTNLVEGINFYSKYMDTLTKFKNSCVDFAMARRMEASELAR
ncbi:ALIX V-shaped domain binding to HIV-domain-containing protein [Radiomyces spectabilis]|uniref:ALIX V-shaped domain binding to HIV-domain-containing protein n=1 Tax=Radiomyces spectabilis TaxID=64574 RepID=UPI00221FD556|nr:ALIX V-shaped domain binding to HIV-domain-containing protein [Radiomyces spectabilis]KAI8393304.1 ALIX V-shaped domain binding to HIV-domain-containing protein [Radiomyces spectabilis]